MKFNDKIDDAFIVCKNCGHIKDTHNFDDFDGWSCIEDNCYCKNFKPKVDEEENVIYEEEEE